MMLATKKDIERLEEMLKKEVERLHLELNSKASSKMGVGIELHNFYTFGRPEWSSYAPIESVIRKLAEHMGVTLGMSEAKPAELVVIDKKAKGK